MKMVLKVFSFAILSVVLWAPATAGDLRIVEEAAILGLKPIGSQNADANRISNNLNANMLITSSIQNSGKINGTNVPFLLPFAATTGSWGTNVNSNCTYQSSGTVSNPCSFGPAPGAQPQSQQQLALWDAVTAGPNARNFADGLGSALGYAYQNTAVYQTTTQTNTPGSSQWRGLTSGYGALDILLNYTYAVMDAATDNSKDCLGKSSSGTPCSTLMSGAQSNIYGRTYLLPSLTQTELDTLYPRGNPRPLVTRPYQSDSAVKSLSYFNSTDYFGNRVNSQAWLGPVPCRNGATNCFLSTRINGGNPQMTDTPCTGGNDCYSVPQTPVGGTQTSGTANQSIAPLYGSASYPSGHSTDGYAETTLLAIVFPERYQQLVTRGAEYAFSRLVLGAHYAADTISARTLAYYSMAQLMGNNPDYMNVNNADSKASSFLGTRTYELTGDTQNIINAQNGEVVGNQIASIYSFRDLTPMARQQVAPILQSQCGSSFEMCAAQDTGRFADLSKDAALYESALSMGLPVVYESRVNSTVNFKNLGLSNSENALAANAGYLLWTRFPYLTQDQRNDVLSTTVTSGGGFLDDGLSAFGAFSRINLFKAAGGYGAFNDITGDVSITMNSSLGGFNASDTWSNNIGGNRGFILNGNGVMRFTGNSTYLGPTIVNGGSLIIDGSIISRVTVNDGGLLGGHGSFGGGIINLGGVISPGNSPGTITSNGDLTLQSGSTYLVEVDGAQADKILVNGRATVNGAVLVLNTMSQPAYLVGRRFSVLSATEGVTGSFGGLVPIQSFSFLNASLSYDANNAFLGYNLTPFSVVARSINQRNVGNALTVGAYGPISGPGANILNTLFYGSYQSAQSVMDTVGGAGLAGVQTTAMEVGEMASSTVSDQIAFWRSGEDNDSMGITLHEVGTLDHRRGFMSYAPVESGVTTKSPIKVNGPVASFAAPAPSARTFRAWGSMFGGGANFLADAGRGTPVANLGYYGGLLGVDYQIAPNALIGVALGGSTANFSAGSLATSGNLTGFHAGLYGSYAMGFSYVALNETFSAYSNQTNRTAGGYSFLPYESLSANFGSSEFRTRLEGGHSIFMGGLKATPFVATEVAIYNNNGFSENSSLYSQSSLALKNNGQTMHSLPTFVGLRLANAYTLSNGWRLAPIGSVAYVHEFFPQRQFTNILMSLPGQDFSVSGPRSTYNLVQTKIGAQLHLTNQFALFSDFQGEFSPVSQSYGGKVGMKYVW